MSIFRCLQSPLPVWFGLFLIPSSAGLCLPLSEPARAASIYPILSPDSGIVFEPRLGKTEGNPHYFLPYRELVHARVGLALSGGGARCLVQIGVLQALEENKIPIDFIVGTSMGSIIGGLYAAGYNAQQLGEIMKAIDWNNVLTDAPPRQNLLVSQKLDQEPFLLQMRFRGLAPQIPRALTAGQKLHSILRELTWRANYWASASFDNLGIPFRAVATDLYTGREVLIASGDLSEVMCASSALPLLLAPVPREDMLLIDGGVKNNIPVEAVRRQGMDLVIAVDATSNLLPVDQLALPWQIADQVTTIMQQERNEQQKRLADVLISFKDSNRTSLDFSDIDSLIALGYGRTMEKMENLRRLYAEKSKFISRSPAFTIRHVDYKNLRTEIPDFAPFAHAHGAQKESLTASAIQEHVEALYAGGDFRTVRAHVRGDTLTFMLQKNPRLLGIEILGNTLYADSVLLNCMQSRPGEIINHQQGREDLRALIEHYRRDGYALAEIRSIVFDSTGRLCITIDEGRLAAIDLEGLRQCEPFVVQREFSLKAGEIFDSKRARQGLDNIHSTGLFEKVSLTPVRQDTGGARLQIKLEEKPFGTLRAGGYYQSERGTYGLLEIGNENVLGSASQLHLYGTAGSRGFLTKMTWHNDRVFSTFLTFAASVYGQSWDAFVYPAAAADKSSGEYQDRRWGLTWMLGQQVRRFGALSAELRWENIRLNSISGSGYPTGESNILSLTVQSIIDTRDQLPFTRTGRYVNLAYEYAKPSAPEAASFVKFLAQLESFHALGPHTLHPKFIGGIADATTPFSEQFRLSGPTPVFGLRDQELIGRNLIVASLEYRYQLRKRPLFDVYFGVRYDLSGIWRDHEEATVHEFRHALGLSVTADTPLLPIGIAFGWLERWQKRVYFNVGVPF